MNKSLMLRNAENPIINFKSRKIMRDMKKFSPNNKIYILTFIPIQIKQLTPAVHRFIIKA